MSVQLHQLKHFSQLAGALEAVTAAQIASVQPGAKLPVGAVVVGQMPDAMKALLVLWYQANTEQNNAAIAYIRAATEGERLAAGTAGMNAMRKTDKLRDLFWTAFKSEVGERPVKASMVGYGPKFEMYYVEGAEPEDHLEGLLDGGRILVVSLGG